jgi:hypothetical protein
VAHAVNFVAAAAAAVVVAAGIGTVINHGYNFCRGDVRMSVAPFLFHPGCLRNRFNSLPRLNSC